MPGLFGTLNIGAQSLQVQRQAIEVTGHNLANVNNPAYARQRVNITTALAIPTSIGPMGAGAQVTGIEQLRSAIIGRQVQAEASIRGFLDAQQSALEYGQAILGESIDRQASATAADGGQHGIAEELAD